jgi:hypothetical protein
MVVFSQAGWGPGLKPILTAEVLSLGQKRRCGRDNGDSRIGLVPGR